MYYLYFISDRSNCIKVGITNDLDKRLATLSTGNHSSLELLDYIACSDRAAAVNLEQQIHNDLSRCHHRLEFYRCGMEMLKVLSSLETAKRTLVYEIIRRS